MKLGAMSSSVLRNEGRCAGMRLETVLVLREAALAAGAPGGGLRDSLLPKKRDEFVTTAPSCFHLFVGLPHFVSNFLRAASQAVAQRQLS
jgi:hypothetical protein